MFMRILVVTQYFFPENFRINQLCLDLKERGHKITVLTGKPNYPQGEYFDGYSFKGNDDEIWNGIPIKRVPLRSRKKGAVNLILNYASFVWNGNKGIRKLKNEYDLIYVFEVSPMTVALPAIKFKKKTGIPIVINIQDLWPENIIAVTGINNKIVIGLINKLVDYISKHCDCILCASPSFVDKIKDRIKAKEKVKYWPQYSIVSKSKNNENIFDSTKFNIVFTGNIGEAQGIDLAIKTAKELENENIHWHFIGNGRNKEKLELLVQKLFLEDKVTFHGFKPEKEIPKYLADASAALLILKPNPVFEMTIPAKLQTYLSCGVPILGCVSGEGKKIIDEANCGITADQISVEALTEATKLMLNLEKKKLDEFKRNSLNFGEKNFNRKILLDKLEDYMEELK